MERKRKREREREEESKRVCRGDASTDMDTSDSHTPILASLPMEGDPSCVLESVLASVVSQ